MITTAEKQENQEISLTINLEPVGLMTIEKCQRNRIGTKKESIDSRFYRNIIQ